MQKPAKASRREKQNQAMSVLHKPPTLKASFMLRNHRIETLNRKPSDMLYIICPAAFVQVAPYLVCQIACAVVQDKLHCRKRMGRRSTACSVDFDLLRLSGTYRS